MGVRACSHHTCWYPDAEGPHTAGDMAGVSALLSLGLSVVNSLRKMSSALLSPAVLLEPSSLSESDGHHRLDAELGTVGWEGC